MIKLLLLAAIPFMAEHRTVAPKTEVSTNFYGSVTGIVDKAYVEGLGIEPVDTQAVIKAANDYTDSATGSLYTATVDLVKVATNDVLKIESDPTIGLTNGTIHIKGETITPLTSFTETDPTVPAWAKAPNPPQGMPTTGLVWNATANAVKTANSAKTIGAADIGAFPKYGSTEYEYAEWDSGLKVNQSGTSITVNPIAIIVGDYESFLQFPYGVSGEFAVNNWKSLSAMLDDANSNPDADCECIKSNMCKLIQQELNRTVNANLNTYIDGETGVEYVGKFYDGSLYYVPTGNVYPPNN